MSLLKQLGSAPLGEELTPAQETQLDLFLADSYGRMPASWKQAISASQLEELIAGIVLRFLSISPSASTSRAVTYLLSKTTPNACSGGGGDGATISPDPDNRLENRPNGLYAKPPAWANKEW